MILTEETLRFIREHRYDDVRSLALQAGKYPDIDMHAAVTQIAGRQLADKKIPAWANTEGILYPQHLSLEQCSSEKTAKYKVELVTKTINHTEPLTSTTARGAFTDLTGGFGIDCAFLSACFRQATYVERQEPLCEIAAHNFSLLGLKHITVCHEDSIRHLQGMPRVDWIFIDPARRDGHGGKTVAIADCEPNVAELEPMLLAKAQYVMVKLSPMLDLSLSIQDLKQVQEAHIVSVNNECKELLLILGHGAVNPENIPIHCVNLQTKGEKSSQETAQSSEDKYPRETEQSFTFTRRQESSSPGKYTDTLDKYLYEPNSSILKAGAFRNLSTIYGVKKLHPNSHLYTSGELTANFPGRSFRITGLCTLNKKDIKAVLGDTRKANITVRNFPLSVAELRKRIKLSEGGEVYVFATTLNNEQKVLIRCEKCRQTASFRGDVTTVKQNVTFEANL
ncbi:THUMP-like domain-containing protein [Bacteroides sp. UBA939]|uniref:THUMP-like domain-containing protein n=1 Tax=Bacteroides sp. UBA939 TaxID=1946092 RepID=UPI0025BE187C|nr:SAM-dependent methyltransferase [Bacteroides sp. UBA939]